MSQQPKLLMIFLCFMYINSGRASGPPNISAEVVAWPDAFYTVEGNITMYLFEFGMEADHCKLYCGDKWLSVHVLKSREFDDYTVNLLTASVKECSKTTSIVRLDCSNYSVKYKTYKAQGVVYSSGQAIEVPVCPHGGGVIDATVPATDDLMIHMKTTMLYCKIKGFTHKRTGTMTAEGNHYYKSGTEYCRQIFVMKKTLNCTKYETSQRLVEQNQNDAWCKISSASVIDSDLLEIRVPHRKGGLVCVNGRFKKKKHQQCRSVESSGVSFKIPSGIKSVEITCDGERSYFFTKEEPSVYCPMPIPDSSFSMRVCQHAYKPILFWISILWACVGIPILYTMNKLYIYVKCKLYLWRMKKGIKCNFCCQTIMSELDARNHFSCEKFICPYCEFRESSLRSLKIHAEHCMQKETVESNTNEVLEWEKNYYSNYYSITNRRVRIKLKVFWALLFVLIFMSTFAPSVADQPNLWYPGYDSNPLSNIRIDNPVRGVHYNPRDSPEQEELIPKTGSCASSHLLATSTATIKKDIEMLGDHVESIGSQTTKTVIEALADVEGLIRMQLEQIDANLINLGVCGGEFHTLNLNMYLPPSLQRSEYSLVKVHKDSVDDINKFGVDLQNLALMMDSANSGNGETGVTLTRNGNNKQPERASLGQDAVMQFGGSTQIVSKGDGDKRSIAANGGTSINMENMNLNNPLDVAHRLANRSPPSPRHEPVIDTSPPRWSNRKLQSLDDTVADEIEIEQTKLNIEREKMEELKAKEAFEERVKNNPITDFHIFRRKQVHIKGKNHQVSQLDLHSKKKPIESTKSKPFTDTHTSWFDFHQEVGVCKKSCLHEPGTCDCISEQMPPSGKMHLPWTTFEVDDIHFVVNPNKYSSVTVSIESETKSDINVKFNTEVKMDLYENSFVSMQLINDKAAISPTLTLTIPRISQIYSTKFLYYTCEREMTTEVKGVCTGTCGDYCAGKVCLGSRIWKFENCRTWSCNPTWCWAWNDGCCCCGSIAQCPKEKSKASVWETRYLRTEYLLCLILNDRVQNCKLVTGTEKVEFGQFQVGATKAIDPADKLPSIIMIVHKPVKNELDHIVTYDSNNEIYLDPPVCKGLTACNHGFIGDLQTTRFECIQKIGVHCTSTLEELNADFCTHRTHMTHSDSNMHMQCHTGEHHSCHHDNIVKVIEFDKHLEDTEKLEERFNINKLKINFDKNELLIYPQTKESSGFIMLNIEGADLAMPKKDNPPKILNAQSLTCSGCYSCSLGFECDVNIETETDEATSVRIKTVEGSIDMSLSPIMIMNGKNALKVRGIAYENVKKAKVCISFGSSCLYEMKISLDLHQPEGSFIPVFENDLVSGGSDGGECSGFDWFRCAGKSFTGFFGMLFSNWKTLLIIIACVVVIGVILAFLPQICLFGRVVGNTVFKKKSKTFSQGPKVSDIYKDLSKKIDNAMKKRTKYKVDDDEGASEETKLFIQQADISDLV